jgi:precorrin-6B methylase 2
VAISRELGLLIIFLASVGLVSVLWTALIGAAWSPTTLGDVRAMLELADVGPTDTVYDLGSGDGRIVVSAASTFGATAIGVEADPLRVAWSRFVARVLGVSGKVTVIRGNFYDVDLSKATVVTMFLTQGTLQKLKPKLLRELHPGTRVVSQIWTFDGWEPVKKGRTGKSRLYVIGKSEVAVPQVDGSEGKGQGLQGQR